MSSTTPYITSKLVSRSVAVSRVPLADDAGVLLFGFS
jgi:hypothetical protein